MGLQQLENISVTSTVTSKGMVELRLSSTLVSPISTGELLVRVEAAPINPSDIGTLLAAGDPKTATASIDDAGDLLSTQIAGRPLSAFSARLDKPLMAGNEAAGTVIDASPELSHLIGKTVAMLGGAMYARYRTIAATDCVILPDGIAAVEGAAIFINPLTALSMIETMRLEGHSAIVHTAAASNLGQMLCKLCAAEGISLVNIVRDAAQAAILHDLGAEYVINSSEPDFARALTDAIDKAGATIAFDAVGGGNLANAILHAMEAALLRKENGLPGYGSETFKQVYLYGSLDFSVSELDRRYGMSWGVGGFLLTWCLKRFGAAKVKQMKQRVIADLLTTFASSYSTTIGLNGFLDVETIRSIAKRATGEKYVLDPRI